MKRELIQCMSIRMFECYEYYILMSTVIYFLTGLLRPLDRILMVFQYIQKIRKKINDLLGRLDRDI